MYAPRFRHPVAVILGIFIFLFQSVADAREVGCSHHSAVEHPADQAAVQSPAPHAGHAHSASATSQDGGDVVHATHDMVAGEHDSPAGEQCNCGPLCSGLAAPPPPLPEMSTRVRTSWSPVAVPLGTGVEVLPVHRIPPALLNLPPPAPA